MAEQLGGEPISFLGAGGGAADARHAVFYAVTSCEGVYAVELPEGPSIELPATRRAAAMAAAA